MNPLKRQVEISKLERWAALEVETSFFPYQQEDGRGWTADVVYLATTSEGDDDTVSLSGCACRCQDYKDVSAGYY
jgi:hypothetical protein